MLFLSGPKLNGVFVTNDMVWTKLYLGTAYSDIFRNNSVLYCNHDILEPYFNKWYLIFGIVCLLLYLAGMYMCRISMMSKPPEHGEW